MSTRAPSWRAPVLRAVEAVPVLRRNLLASCDYRLIPPTANGSTTSSTGEAVSGWYSRRTAQRQDRAWSRLTNAALSGEPRQDIQAVIDALSECPPQSSVLEVGCGTGYFSDIIGHYCPQMTYTGVDYSSTMVELARTRRPDRTFVPGDATDLPFPSDSFDVIIDGAALIHIPSWQQALAEYARVAREAIILSSLTIADIPSTRTVEKLAYGSPVVELVFSREELHSAIAAVGRRVDGQSETLPYVLNRYIGIATTSETWVCR